MYNVVARENNLSGTVFMDQQHLCINISLEGKVFFLFIIPGQTE